jgi:hypothetical protein
MFCQEQGAHIWKDILMMMEALSMKHWIHFYREISLKDGDLSRTMVLNKFGIRIRYPSALNVQKVKTTIYPPSLLILSRI